MVLLRSGRQCFPGPLFSSSKFLSVVHYVLSTTETECSWQDIMIMEAMIPPILVTCNRNASNNYGSEIENCVSSADKHRTLLKHFNCL